MNERELRRLIGDVKKGKLSRRGFVQRMMAVGLAAPMATQLLAYSGVAMAQAAAAIQADQARRRRPAEGAVVAGGDLAQSAFRGRHQGSGRLALLLRAAGRLGCRRQPPARAGRLDSRPRGRNDRCRRQVGDLEAEAGRDLARRQAVHRRRRRLQLGIREGSRHRRHHQCRLQGRQGREGRPVHGQGDVPEADAVLGTRLRRRPGHDHPQASVRRLCRRQVARCADQPQAGRHRSLQVQGLQAGRHGVGRDQSQLPHGEPALFRRHRNEGRRRRRLGGARGAADRRVRLRLEHAGRGRDPRRAWKRAARARSSSRRAATSSTSSSTPPIPGPRSTASARASRPSIRRSAIRRCARRSPCWSTRTRSRSTSTAAPASPRRTSSTIRSASAPRPPSASSTSTRPTTSSRRRAGRRAPTASARRTARS